ncbi:acetylcholine receptor subunit alpha-1-B-like [Actinia tenebrosa]|uniref:Acetylcholine receptor subunit alpha-1-B-like n=1 Tax=Actinia tenebrosa TaxID=6105 RepID=A0A6P8IDK6_ACTTE|nr:acetylcholine receptor subunit alpha-1-B-like [Actinia tenebrosa]
MAVSLLEIVICFLLTQELLAVTNEDRLITSLVNITRYSPKYRPVLNTSEPVMVQHGLILRMIANVDEKNMVLSTIVRMHMGWQDKHLTWDPATYGGLRQVHLDANDIWTPPLILYNNADGPLEYSKVRALVKHDGNVTWLVATMIKSSCNIDVKHFPFDEQLCKLTFGSWSHDVTKLNIQSLQSTVGTSRYLTNGEWTLKSTRAERTQVSHICCKHDVARITYTIRIKRKTLFYMTNFILPCAIIAFLTLLVFLTPVETGERMAVGVTILLALAVFFLMLEATMPKSNDLPLLAKYYCCTVIEIVCGLVAMSWILRLVHHSPEPLYHWIKRVVLGYVARFLLYDTGHFAKPNKIKVQEKTNDDNHGRLEIKYATKWTRKLKNKNTMPDPVAAENKTLKILTQNIKEEEKTEGIKEQWQLVANVMNRLFTCLFLLAAVVTLLAVFTNH